MAIYTYHKARPLFNNTRIAVTLVTSEQPTVTPLLQRSLFSLKTQETKCD